jgi:hypothetical protein
VTNGPVYLEYKRQQTEQYLTTGIGLQARRNSHLDFWGFVLTDNRRIKHDLLLYKAEINPENGSKQRIPLTRPELERAVGSGGQMVRSQKDYMELVNRHIFGFETAEQYQELMKLLIQLRSLKLSKDFKPSVIYEILNESLPSLSNEELGRSRIPSKTWNGPNSRLGSWNGTVRLWDVWDGNMTPITVMCWWKKSIWRKRPGSVATAWSGKPGS